VLFETYDGTFGVDKSFVVKVEKSDKPVRLITTAQAAAEAKPVETAEKEAMKQKPLAENQEQVPAKKTRTIRSSNILCRYVSGPKTSVGC
jgi:hypothetical protein